MRKTGGPYDFINLDNVGETFNPKNYNNKNIRHDVVNNHKF